MFLCLRAIREENAAKVEKIYSLYKNLMFNIAYDVLHNIEDAEDTVHDAFISLASYLENIDIPDSPETKSLIAVITKNKAIDLYRQKQLRNRRILLISIDEINSDCFQVESSAFSIFSEAIELLPEHMKNILLLKFDKGYSCEEIAKLLRMNKTTVQKYITRAKKQLQLILDTYNE